VSSFDFFIEFANITAHTKSPFLNGFDCFCRYSRNYRQGRHVLCYHCACGDYRVVANANARQHGGVRAYPHVFSYHDGRRLHTFPTLGIQVVIECCKHNLMTDQSAVAYGYAALVLKTASGIYKHVFAYRYVFAAVGVKGRKQQKRFVCFFANQPEKQFAYFFGRKIFSVYFRRNFPRVASQKVHTSVCVGACGDIRIFFDKFNVFFCIHIFKSFNLFYV